MPKFWVPFFRKCLQESHNGRRTPDEQERVPLPRRAHSDPKTATASFTDFKEICSELGLQLAPEKSVEPSIYMEWLGYQVDTEKMQVSIPREKLDKTINECKQWETKMRGSKTSSNKEWAS